MGICGSADAVPTFEVVGDPISLTITAASVTMTASMQTSLFSAKENSVEVKDDNLLNEIMQQADQGRPVIKVMPKIEAPPADMKAMKSVQRGEPIDIVQNYDCIFGPAVSSPLTTTMMDVPIDTQSNVNTFGSSVDIAESGMTTLQQTIEDNFAQGFRLVAMLLSNDANINIQKGAPEALIRLVFQKSESFDPFTTSLHLHFPLEVKMTMRGMEMEAFDPLPDLNKYGAQGYELVDIIPVGANAPAMPTVGSTITTIYLATMAKSATNTPTKFCMKEVNLKMSMGMSGASITGDVIPAIQAAAESGWKFVTSIQMAPKQSGMSQLLPFQLYFQSQGDE